MTACRCFACVTERVVRSLGWLVVGVGILAVASQLGRWLGAALAGLPR